MAIGIRCCVFWERVVFATEAVAVAESSREDIPSSQKCYWALFTPLGRPLGIIPRLIFVCISFLFWFHLFYNSIFSLVCHSTSFLVLSKGYQINFSKTPLPDFFDRICWDFVYNFYLTAPDDPLMIPHLFWSRQITESDGTGPPLTHFSPSGHILTYYQTISPHTHML